MYKKTLEMTQLQEVRQWIRLLHSAIHSGDIGDWVLRVWGRRTIASASLSATYANFSWIAYRFRTASSMISARIDVSFGLGFV